MKVDEILKTIAKEIEKRGGRAILVGGSVRDHLLGIEAKDFDIEVYGLKNLDELENLLKVYGKVKLVGKSFGVLKFVYEQKEYDFAFPRIEKKVAKGHRGFDIRVDGSLAFREAARRRDFTINALGYDLKSQELLDPFGGRDDLKNQILKHIDENSFVEDPLRVYRGVQFCARFELKMEQKTKELCKNMTQRGELDELPKERVFEEIKKLLLKAKKPSIGFELLREFGVVERYFPELFALVGVAQDPIWHPEGDVWIHTMMVIDEMAKRRVGDERRDLILMLSALCHDLGKATTTEYIDGRYRSYRHEKEGVLPTISFIRRLSDESRLLDEITPIVANHLAPFTLHRDNASNKAVRRLSTKVNIPNLVKVAEADFYGRDTKEAREGEFEAGEWLLKRAKELEVLEEAPKPLLMGRDLIELGLKPSKRFKEILDHIYQMQLDGEIKSKTDAIKKVKEFNF